MIVSAGGVDRRGEKSIHGLTRGSLVDQSKTMKIFLYLTMQITAIKYLIVTWVN